MRRTAIVPLLAAAIALPGADQDAIGAITTPGDARSDWLAAASVYQIVAPGHSGIPPRRLMAIYDAERQLRREINHAISFVPNASTWGGDQDAFRAKLDAYVPTLAPAAIAYRDDGTSPVAMIATAARQDALTAIMEQVAFEVAMRRFIKGPMQQYIPSIDGLPGAPLAIITETGKWTQEAIHTETVNRNLRVVPERIGEMALTLASVMAPKVENRAVRELVIQRVLPRIDQAGALTDPGIIDKAKAYVRKRAAELVTPDTTGTYSPSRIDMWSQQLTREANQISSGALLVDEAGQTTDRSSERQKARKQTNRRGAKQAGGKNGQRPTSFVTTQVGDGPMVGLSESRRAGRQVTIPATSHAKALILTGAEVEIGGSQGLPIMLTIPDGFRGPNGSFLPMANLRLIGQAQHVAGIERVSVTLDRLSYVFPSGKTIDLGISGYVIDSDEGIEGARGVFDWNVEKIMPWATVAGGLEGMGDALRTNSEVTIVTDETTTVSQTGDKLENAVYAGAAEGAGIMADYVRRVLDLIKPVIRVVNGQAVTVIIDQPVVFDVPESDWTGVFDPALLSGLEE